MDSDTTIYLCADATLTYGPLGDTKKIIPRALPVCQVESPEEAERIITLVGSQSYGKRQGYPNPVHEGHGPKTRTRYSLEDYQRGNVDDLFVVSDTLAAIRDALRSDDRDALTTAFEASKKGKGFTMTPVYEEG